MSNSRLRLIFAVVVLVISLAALAWGFLPGARIVLRQKIQPTEMQLPTPSGYRPADRPVADQGQISEATCAIYGAERFVLLI